MFHHCKLYTEYWMLILNTQKLYKYKLIWSENKLLPFSHDTGTEQLLKNGMICHKYVLVGVKWRTEGRERSDVQLDLNWRPHSLWWVP